MATEKVIKIVVDKEGADKSVKQLDSSLKNTEKSTSKLTNELDKMSGGAVSGFKGLKNGISSAVNGFKSLRVAIIGTGIGALIIGILAVKEAFTSSEEGQNKFAKLMGVIGSITGNLSDILSNLGMKIINAFENPKQAVQSFGNLIKDNIVNRFNGLLEFIPQLGKAIKQLFKGDFSGASETAVNAVAKVALGTENLTDSIKGASKALKQFGKEIAEDAKKAQEIADKRAKADIIDRNLITARAKATRDIAELRFKAEQRDKFTAEERIKLLKEASEIEEAITKREIYSAQLRLSAKVAENSLSNSTKEDLNEEANLRSKIIDLETKKLNLSKRLETQIQTAQNEVNAQLLAEQKAKQEALDAEEKLRIEKAEKDAKNEQERLEKIAEIQDEFREKRENELAETELEKIELEKERKLKELEDLEATEEQKASIVKYYNDKINAQTIEDQKKADAEKVALEEKVADAKNNIANRTASLLIELAGKASKVGKAIAVAQTIRSGIEGVQNAYSTAQKSPITALFPAYPIVQAGLAGAFSALQVKKILSTSDTGGGGQQATQDTSAPSFNLVQGTPENQLANTISGASEKPVTAIVVSSSVTTAQQANRNKIEESSI